MSKSSAPDYIDAPCPDLNQVRRRYHAVQGSAAEDRLVRECLPLVRNVVGRIAMTLPPHVDLDDLHSAGVIGLLNALRNFDENNGASFETYARIRIHGAIIDELRRMDCVSRTMRSKARHVQDVIAQLEQRKGEPPTEEEVARALKLSLAEYEALLDEIRPVTFVCLDAVIGGRDGGEQYETMADDNQETPVETASKRELAHLIAQRIQQLPEVQRKVLALYYFEDLRLREIAEAFGVTESRICQIHTQAILGIKAWLRNRESRTTT
ncbi:MAG TPA: FliA/WhiG family RNA polymerase sigma factor [Verrucomicrobiae bacterium]|nr:FliA/WhiG family RNA polymerase sigma factor [Verrucomicrobiae bacterium]